MEKQYLDYEGLKLYTQEFKKWVLAQISGAGNITPAEVDAKIAAAMSAVDSKYDDTRIFSSYDEFKDEPGIVDVLYVAQDTGMQYIWNSENEEFEPLEEAIPYAAISDIINT